MSSSGSTDDTRSDVSSWSSILTLIVFFLTSKILTPTVDLHSAEWSGHIIDIIIIFPSSIPIPSILIRLIHDALVSLRIIPPSSDSSRLHRRYFRVNFITVPLISVLVLLACGAIDGTTVRRGIIGADGVQPINIMALFISLVSFALSLRTLH